MRGGETGLSDERVRRALAHLGADSASAPEVPAAVTARIVAALRATPAPPAHATGAGLPRLSRLRVILLTVAIAALLAAAAAGIVILLHGAPASRFPSGPTAETMTVSSTPADTPKAVVTLP